MAVDFWFSVDVSHKTAMFDPLTQLLDCARVQAWIADADADVANWCPLLFLGLGLDGAGWGWGIVVLYLFPICVPPQTLKPPTPITPKPTQPQP